MGLLDNLAGAALGAASGANSPAGGANIVGAVLEMLGGSQIGGIGGLVQMFTQKGLGGLVQSWVGTGANLPVAPDQLSQALGPEVMGQIAGRTGLQGDQLGAMLSQILPNVVDKLTPTGQVPAQMPSATDAASLLGSLFGGGAR